MTSSRSLIAADLDGLTLQFWHISSGTAGPAQTLALPDSRTATLAAALRQAMGTQEVPVLLSGSPLAPPAAVPAEPAQQKPVETVLDGLAIHALPGLCQRAPSGLLMGGAARLTGFLQLNPDWDGVVCLPGPVTHWVHVSAREAVSFQSAMTLPLAQSSAAALQLDLSGSWDSGSLTGAVADGLARPETLAARLGSVQAAAALGQIGGAAALGQLWGLLIGAELAAARPYWLGQNLALVAAAPLQAPYAAALEAQALPVTLADPARMALEGLQRAWAAR